MTRTVSLRHGVRVVLLATLMLVVATSRAGGAPGDPLESMGGLRPRRPSRRPIQRSARSTGGRCGSASYVARWSCSGFSPRGDPTAGGRLPPGRRYPNGSGTGASRWSASGCGIPPARCGPSPGSSASSSRSGSTRRDAARKFSACGATRAPCLSIAPGGSSAGSRASGTGAQTTRVGSWSGCCGPSHDANASTDSRPMRRERSRGTGA